MSLMPVSVSPLHGGPYTAEKQIPRNFYWDMEFGGKKRRDQQVNTEG